jgi:hypothetical protein
VKPQQRRYTVNKAELKKRSALMTKDARAAVANRGIMQFRAEPEDILALYDLAMKRKQRISTMIRGWVLERLELERGNAPLNLDITVNKEKVGSVSLTPEVFDAINGNLRLRKTKAKRSKAG